MAFTSVFTGAQIDARLGGTFTGVAITATSFNSITALASSVSPMNGSAAVGTSTTVARQDHVHASDASKLSTAALGTGTATALAAAPNATGGFCLASGNGGGAFACGALTATTLAVNGVNLYGEKFAVKLATNSNIYFSDNTGVPTVSALTDAGSSQKLRVSGNVLELSGRGFNGAADITITGVGNVLIGTATPSTGAKLEVVGSISSTTLFINGTDIYNLAAGLNSNVGVYGDANASSGVVAYGSAHATLAGKVLLRSGAATIATVSSTGLAVTGSISATTSISASGGVVNNLNSSPALSLVYDMRITAVSNTQIKFEMKGGDSVSRSYTMTLA